MVPSPSEIPRDYGDCEQHRPVWDETETEREHDDDGEDNDNRRQYPAWMLDCVGQ